MLTGIYVGGIYGGAITAITVRIPGAPANTMTLLDGHAMAKAGRTEEALGLATFSSFVGGIGGGIVLVLFAPQLARAALRFQSPETFSLLFLALVAVSAVSLGPFSKSLAATTLGLMLSTVGLDKLVPVGRFTLDVPDLLVGVPLLPVVIGLFALSEFLWQAGEPHSEAPQASDDSVHSVQWRRTFDFLPTVKRVGGKLFAKSAAIGAFIGALPGAGAAMAAFLAYAEAKRSSHHPDKFGTGIPEGIVAPETANNAMTGGAFVPMLAFGIPGDAVTAVMLGGLIIQGLTPGPALFRDSGDIMTSLFVGYFIAYVLVLVLGLALLPWFARLATLPRIYLLPMIGSVSLVAAYASERTAFALGLTVAIHRRDRVRATAFRVSTGAVASRILARSSSRDEFQTRVDGVRRRRVDFREIPSECSIATRDVRARGVLSERTLVLVRRSAVQIRPSAHVFAIGAASSDAAGLGSASPRAARPETAPH